MSAPVLDRPVGEPPEPEPGDGFDTAPAAPDRWTTDGIAETLPGVLPPLRWEAAAPLLEEALRNLLADLGGLAESTDLEHPLVARIRCRAALRTDAVDALAAVGAGARERSWRHRTGHDLRLVRLRRSASCEAETCIVAAATVVAATLPIEALADEALLAYRRRLLDLAGRTATAEAGVAVAASAAYQHLERALVARLGDADGAAWARRLTSGGVATATAWLYESAARLRGTLPPDRLHELAETDTWDAARSLLREPAATDLLDAARRAGSAAVFAGPTWDERPDLVWPALRRTLREPHIDGAPRADGEWTDLVATLRALPGWGRTRVLTGQVVDIRLHLLARVREDAVTLLDRRERTKAALLAIGGEVRRAHLELGRRLHDRGRLDDPGDVELLSGQEMVAALTGGSPSRGELERRRRWIADTEGGAVTGGDPDRPRPHVLHGAAASPGHVRGRARVVRSVDEMDLVEPGGVIVARTTDPSWTFLLMEAAAIVVEQGGMLSHAAILARELHIPAVIGIPGVVDRLSAASYDVDVDGDHGTVTLLASHQGGPDER